ncbi:peptidase s41 family protein [Colletotrichum musicola]|uniref:Peptidase s41 family protein n=1 Tax=Colletotrichum musicola TaxID=2175873 RepID=A0A8H6U5U8_9PEZI|nr:peptidase s41 family protein [Colletotrichum musicola]
MLFTLLTVFVYFGLLCGLSFAQPHGSLPKDLPRRQDATEEIPMCGRIIDAVDKGHRFFYARDAHECLTSVPFHPAPALRFIDYYNTTIQFQSTLAHLKSPPEGYQQPAFDLMQGLEDLKRNVTDGVFQNQYDFEATMQHLIYSVHDAHVYLRAGVLSAFSFASPVALVAASIDGKEAPKIYFAEDIIFRQKNLTNGVFIDISPVSHINGEPAVEYLTKFAALQSVGMLEPHADWNELMGSPVQDIQGIYSIFAGSSTFYPGDTLNFAFEDPQKQDLETYWIAIYDNEEFTGPLTTGGDFYNFFVLGQLPASYYDVLLPLAWGGVQVDENGEPVSGGGQLVEAERPTSWYDRSATAFPQNPDIRAATLATYGANSVTGYFYEDMSTGVLSIPHFRHYEDDLGEFGELVINFMDGAEQKGLEHVIIDLQKNSGGSTASALLLFRELFPGADPFTGSQRRSHELANVLGSATTHKYRDLASGNEEEQDVGFSLVADEWTILTRLNAETGNNFSSWEEYQGPRQQLDDDFSLVEQYDLKNPNFHVAAFDGWLLSRYLNESDAERQIPWTPENVVILTDGSCSSACAIFVEIASQAGAHTVVVGGAPHPGPMQAASGTRGARVYTGDDLDYDFEWIGDLNETSKARFPPHREDQGIFIKYAGFNLRDQLRADDTSTPLQFRYAAADCRLYFTIDNVYNMSALWHDVARAAFDDPSLCVEDSTGYNSRNGTSVPPKSSAVAAPAPDIAAVFTGDPDTLATGGLPADRYSPGLVFAAFCKRNVLGQQRCPPGYTGLCIQMQYTCGAAGLAETLLTPVCVAACTVGMLEHCGNSHACVPLQLQIEDARNSASFPNPSIPYAQPGYCSPSMNEAAVCTEREKQKKPGTPPPGSHEEQPPQVQLNRAATRNAPKQAAWPSPAKDPRKQGPRRLSKYGK